MSETRAATTLDAIAAEAYSTLGTGRQIAPFSSRYPDFELKDAYRVTAKVRALREKAGEIPRGRKIGFTNRTIWAEFGMDAPMWGYLYNRTIHDLDNIDGTFSLAGVAEPRVEPEIVFGLSAAPRPGMDARELLTCIDWVAQGFEVVQSIFPAWRFAPADTVAAFGMHGALLIGPRHPLRGREDVWASSLSSFEIDLYRGGELVDHGAARNVLDGPLFALAHLIDVLAKDPASPPLAAGEIITTGTLTQAPRVHPGEVWSTELTGIALDGVSVAFS
jgi:2-oxo-3-hexenedioate decarboxylase